MERYEDVVSPFYTAISEEFGSQALNFPTSFDLVARALRILDDPNSSVKDYTRLVQSDPVLLAKVLRMANSVLFNGSGKEIVSAFEAVQRLGSKKIRCLAFLIMMDQVRQDTRTAKLKRIANIIWKHSIDIGCASYSFAKHTHICDPDEAFLSGLMIDIGQFFIISKLSTYPDIVKNEEFCIKLITASHLSIAKQVLDAMIVPEVVLRVYNHNLTKHPVWPMIDICDIVMLASICTEINNPFLEAAEAHKRYVFQNDFSKDEIEAVDKLVKDTANLKTEMFNHISE